MMDSLNYSNMDFETQTGKSIKDTFDEFHENNPAVYAYFKEYAGRAIRAGVKKLSSKLIINRIRWEIFIETVGNDTYRINDAFTAHYARLYAEDFPAHADKFEFRRIRSE